MPTYDYYCPINGRTVEVRHSFSVTLTDWQAKCREAGIFPGDTPADAPVERLISGGLILKGKYRAVDDSCCGVTGCASH